MELLAEKIGCGVVIFFSILNVAVLVYYINDLILILIPAIKCRKVRDCMDDNCPFRVACTHKKLTEWENLPLWERPPKEQQKKPSLPLRISHWFEDFFF